MMGLNKMNNQFILNSAALSFNFIYKFLSNKKLFRIYKVIFFTYLSAANQDKQKSSMTLQR